MFDGITNRWDDRSASLEVGAEPAMPVCNETPKEDCLEGNTVWCTYHDRDWRKCYNSDAKGCNHLSVQVTQAALMQGGFIEPVMLRSEIDKVGGPRLSRFFVRPIGNRPELAWHFYLRSCKASAPGCPCFLSQCLIIFLS
jgi:hypothetical protein